METINTPTPTGHEKVSGPAALPPPGGGLRQTYRRYRLIVGYCLLLLLLTWGLFYGLTEQDRRHTVDMIYAENDQLTLAYEEYVRLGIRSLDDMLRLIKADYERVGAITHIIGVVFRNGLENPYIHQFSVVGSDGYPVANAFYDTGRTYLGDRPHFVAHIAADTGEPFIGRPIIGRVSGKQSVHISRRLSNPDGTFAGVVIIAVSPDYFTRFFHTMHFQSGKVVRVIGLDGTVRASHPREGLDEIGRDMRQGSKLFEVLNDSPNGHYYSPGLFFGTPRYNSYRVMADYPLIVQVGGDADKAMAPYNQRRINYLLITVAVSLFILISSAFLIMSAVRRRQAEERYRALIAQSFEAIAIVDPASDDIVEINPRFTAMFGYTSPDLPIKYTALIDMSPAAVREAWHTLATDGHLPPAVRTATAKDGARVDVERTVSALTIDGQNYNVISYRNLTKERVMEREIAADAELARRIQQYLLPQPPAVPGIDISTYYQPHRLVSGDTFHLEWDSNASILRGYLLDVTGHGLATALQTAALGVLLRQVAEADLPLADQLAWLNRHVDRYFDEGAFAAAIIFELNLRFGHIRVASAGINELYVNGARILLPGGLLGLGLDDDYGEAAFLLRPGDLFCFVTDGLGDILRGRADDLAGKTAREAADLFAAPEITAALRDDATAICISVGPAAVAADPGA